MYKGNIDIYVTGSNSKFLSKDIITEFRGRDDQIHLYPVTFLELYNSKKVTLNLNDTNNFTNIDLDKLYLEYATYGGMPLALLYQNDLDKANYLNNLFKTTYINDIINRYRIKHIKEFEELINVLASCIGSHVNSYKLSNTFKSTKQINISYKTIEQYLLYLEDSFLIDKSFSYNIKGKKYINTLNKYYFTDIGLRNALLSFRQLEYNHIMENIIYNQLKTIYERVDIGKQQINIKRNNINSKEFLEIDFIVNKIDKRIYIQSCFSIDSIEKQKQEEKSLLSLKDGFKKIIIVKEKILPHYNEQGIYYISLIDFLLNPTIIENI